MNLNTYRLLWEDASEELSMCFMAGLTIAEVDELFAKLYPDCIVVSIELLGDFVTADQTEEVEFE